MSNKLTLLITLTLIFFVASLFVIFSNPSPSGLVVEGSNTYAKTFGHLVNEFFDVGGIYFPPGVCTNVLEELYLNIAPERVDVTQGFETTGRERLASINFVVKRTTPFGTLDMIKGQTLVGEPGIDSLININAETLIRVPKDQRATYMSIELLGISNTVFVVKKGEIEQVLKQKIELQYKDQ